MSRPVVRSTDFPAVLDNESRPSGVLEWADLEQPVDVSAVHVPEWAASRSRSKAVRLVTVFAFAQSLLFLALWLFLCASAGAAPPKKAEFKADLQISVYQPAKTRDPFSPVGGYAMANAASGPSVPLQLEGILYSATEPSAVVNGQLLTLHKPATINLGSGDIKVEAIDVTREKVVLMVGSDRVELHLNQQATPPANPSTSTQPPLK